MPKPKAEPGPGNPTPKSNDDATPSRSDAEFCPVCGLISWPWAGCSHPYHQSPF